MKFVGEGIAIHSAIKEDLQLNGVANIWINELTTVYYFKDYSQEKLEEYVLCSIWSKTDHLITTKASYSYN